MTLMSLLLLNSLYMDEISKLNLYFIISIILIIIVVSNIIMMITFYIFVVYFSNVSSKIVLENVFCRIISFTNDINLFPFNINFLNCVVWHFNMHIYSIQCVIKLNYYNRYIWYINKIYEKTNWLQNIY